MHAKLTPVLLGWNVLLTALVAWALWGRDTRGGTATTPVAADSSGTGLVVPRDTAALANARIACFYMDSVQQRYELVKERGDAFRSEGKRLEGNLQSELAKAQGRYEELMRKDHTYSTQAEMAKDEQELQQLMARIQSQQASSEEQLAKLEAEMLTEITKELRAYLEVYNRTAGYDYIFSVQNGGQIWVGNKGLDISDDLINGLNQRHRSGKATTK